jgi:threonylcarbamoyladenosine tRNA methylthiotransferase MtaB
MKVSILTLGCKVNQAEMSEVESSLRGQGHHIVGIDENPDICVVNTCTVTSKSDYQSRQLIRRAGRTGAQVVVTGCYSELNSDEVGRMEGVERVVTNSDKHHIFNIIDANSSSGTSRPATGRTRYFLKVQDGCNNFCSYCMVHIARGASRSVTPDAVIDKVKEAVEAGFKEVVLTGIHLGQYGCDLDGGITVSSLVSEVLDKTAINRLRLSSLEVNEVDGHLLDLFENTRLMPHLHIPLQSGDDGVLKLMNRGYDTQFYRDKVLELLERLPEAALGTDIIAGFPQETEEAFRNTCSLVENLPFTYMHVFPYSRRPGTPAAEMSDIVGQSERKRRASELRTLAARKRSEYADRQIGRTLEVLIEQKVGETLYRGTSCNYLKVYVASEREISGTVVPACVEAIDGERLIGAQANIMEVIDI